TFTLSPGQYFLVQLGSGGANGVALPTPDAIGTVNMNAASGKVALRNNSSTLISGTPFSDGDTTIVDFLGYGAASDFETTAATGGSNTLAMIRKNGGTVETNNNLSDFTTGSPTPRNSPVPEPAAVLGVAAAGLAAARFARRRACPCR